MIKRTYSIVSVKFSVLFVGTYADARREGARLNAEYQPAFGTQVRRVRAG